MSDQSSSADPFRLRLILLIGLLVLILFCAGVVFPVEFVIYLSLGWISILVETLPKVRPDWAAVSLGAAALAIFAVGLHGFLRWLQVSVTSSETHERRWHVAWTAAIIAVVVMSFVAGVSMVGITHEVAWLAFSEEPIMSNSFMAVQRMASSNHLKQIGLGIQNYHDVFGALPPGATIDQSGRALHSWQTVLLAYYEGLNKDSFYFKIDLQQPWNTASNRPHMSTLIPIYQMPYHGPPKQDREGYALSHYAANQYVISGTGSRTIHGITDGTSNTILCGEAAGNYKPWGNPTNWRDPEVGINTSKKGFGSPHPGGATFVFADGHTAFLTNKTDPKVLRAIATPAGGEPIPAGY